MSVDSSSLFRLVYRSHSGLEGSAQEKQSAIDVIVKRSGERNASAGITGALMFTHELFIQALEGPAAAVEAAFDRICCDLRHREIEVVECSPILECGFGDWSMRQLVPDISIEEHLSCAVDAEPSSENAIRAMKLMVALARPSMVRDHHVAPPAVLFR